MRSRRNELSTGRLEPRVELLLPNKVTSRKDLCVYLSFVSCSTDCDVQDFMT